MFTELFLCFSFLISTFLPKNVASGSQEFQPTRCKYLSLLADWCHLLQHNIPTCLADVREAPATITPRHFTTSSFRPRKTENNSSRDISAFTLRSSTLSERQMLLAQRTTTTLYTSNHNSLNRFLLLSTVFHLHLLEIQ